MSHAASSCAGFAPRHMTFGVTTQKFGIGEPRSSGHAAGAMGVDEDGKLPIRSMNKKESARLLTRANPIGVILALWEASPANAETLTLFKDDVPHRHE